MSEKLCASVRKWLCLGVALALGALCTVGAGGSSEDVYNVVVITAQVTESETIPGEAGEQHEHGVLILQFVLEADQEFSLVYRHSVERTWVRETVRLDAKEGLVLTAMRFESFGAGLPFAPEGGVFSKVDDGYVWSDINLPLGEFEVMSSPENQYTVEYPDGVLLLSDWPLGTVFRFSVIHD